MTTKILTIIFAILAGICYSLYRGYSSWLHFTCSWHEKDEKKLVNAALSMKEIGVKIADKAFILTFIFLFLMGM